jgi:5-methylcytosine-specific restriction endonuclease McrA
MVNSEEASKREIISRKDARENRLNKFFTGKPCKYGHISERYTRNNNCVECALINSTRQAKEKPEKILEYRKNGRDKKNAYMREYNKKNKEKIHEYYIKNKEKIIKQSVERKREWRKENKEKFLAHSRNYVRNRRARRETAEGNHTNEDIVFLLEKQKMKCANCKKSIKFGYHVDHIVPLSLGGRNDKGNLQILCPQCNLSKHALDPIDWANKNGRLL